ncbi:hypothetical protein GF386_03475 [Candidatus Pacearchaeota archaeon]|nr:hypothetical protein [Candidatus Pacearchaeota archaeon]MBD3283202.1 hypothetical protein [Candidatus Pacearchaeota archaeon]
MVGRLQENAIVFSEACPGRKGRLKKQRPVLPISLENVTSIEFRWLCKLQPKRLSLGNGEIEYRLHYDASQRKVYVQNANNSEHIYSHYGAFGKADFYDVITSEISNLQSQLEEFRRNGKLYFSLIALLKEVKHEL